MPQRYRYRESPFSRDQAPGTIHDRFLQRPRPPAEHVLRFRRAEGALLPETRRHGRQALVEQRGEAQDEVGNLARRNLAGRSTKAGAQQGRDIGHPGEVPGCDEALTGRLRRDHRCDMQVGDVAHVHDAEAQARQAGHPARQQAFDELDRWGIVPAENRAEHHGRIDRGESRGAVRGADQIPCGTLGHGLGARIGADPGIVEISPYGFVRQAHAAAAARGGRRHG